MAWRVARGLDRLLAQVNEIAPKRSKLSDGSIGDEAHRHEKSDHNPDSSGVVRARDFTHDPAHGADMHEIAEQLRLSRDRRISYVIWNRRIFSATNQAWTWRGYSGANPHDKHMHVSTVSNSLADDTSDWRITMPLTNDDIQRVAEATAAKVLGKPWDVPGRTLVGTELAILASVQRQEAGQGAAAGKLAEVLAAISADDTTEIVIPDELIPQLAEQIASRLPAGPTAQEIRAVVDEELDEQSRAGADQD